MNKAMKLVYGTICVLAALAASATELPAGYTRVAGLKSAGLSSNAPYIDLGYKPTQNTRVDIDFAVLAWGSGSGLDGYPCPFGACHANNALAFTLTGGPTANDGNCWSYRWGSKTTDGIIIQKSLITGRHNLEANGPSWTIDGLFKEKSGGSSESFTLNTSLYVFARNNNGTMDHPVKMALYGFDIYENGELQHSFVPCRRNSDNELGLYDVAGNKGFLAKSGTGAFTIAGLPAEYTRVAGLKSAGISGSNAPYVNLGYTPTRNTRVDIDFDVHAWGRNSGLDDFPCPFGACHDSNALAFTLTGGNTTSGNWWSYRWGDGSTSVVVSGPSITGTHQLEANGPLWTIDGVTKEKTGGSSETFTMNKSFYVFARNNNGTMDHPVNMTLYGFDIYEGGSLQHSFVPCRRNSDDAPGLYDVIGNKGFLAKSGTGAFTVVESGLEMEGILRAVSNPHCHPKPVVHSLGDISTALVEGTDYTLSYGTSSSGGYTNKWVKATGTNDYNGVVSRKAWYRVAAQSTNAFSVGRIAPVAYEKGQPCTPHPVVRTADGSRTLAEGTDYDLFWFGNQEIGRGYVVISGKHSFAGEVWTEPFSILPVLRGGYKAAEYIRSSGTNGQYIVTGFSPGVNTRADFHFDMEEFGSWSQWAVPFGSRNQGYYQFFAGAARQVSNGVVRDDWYRRFSNKDISDTTGKRGKPAVVGEHFFSLNKTTYTLDDYTDTFTGYNHFQNTYNAYVFAVNNNNVAENHSPMTLYSLKIWDNGTLVRHFVPCVRNDGVAGLYDITPGAVKKFYANDGTGTFEAGPVLESTPPGLVIKIK